jgi:hypothetical protein
MNDFDDDMDGGNDLEDADLVVKDEGQFFKLFANTENGQQLLNDLNKEELEPAEVNHFLELANQRGLTVFEF